MKKRILVNENDIIDVSIHFGYAGYELSIVRSYRIGNLVKNIRFDLWDDIAFNAYIAEDVNTLEFVFDINDPLFSV